MTPDWQTDDGAIRLYCADCLDVLPKLATCPVCHGERFVTPVGGEDQRCGECGGTGKQSIDAVVTDPPYGVGFKYESHDDSEAAYEALITEAISLSTATLREGGASFWWQGMRHADRYHKYFPAGFRLFAAARNFTQHLPTPVQHSWDPVVFWFKGETTRRAVCGQRDYHVGNTAAYVAQKSTGHPCPRPLDTVQYVVGLASDEGDTVLDPFMGSGTTGVACVALGRRFVGIEKERKYFDIAVDRIEAELQRNVLFEKPPGIIQKSLLGDDAA